MNTAKQKLTVIDLFAGAGGLSCGLEQTGVFQVALAVELHPQYQKTYKKNHPGVPVLGDINHVIQDGTFDSLAAGLQSKWGQIDVVAGGPPCQGFSRSNRQRNHLISTNNLLVMSYMKFVQKFQPRAFIMENVSDMPSYSFYVSTDPWDKQALKQSGVQLTDDAVRLGHGGSHSDELVTYLKGYLDDNSMSELPCSQLVNSLYPRLRTLDNYVQRNKSPSVERFLRLNTHFFRRTVKQVAKATQLPECLHTPLLTLLETLAEWSPSIPAQYDGVLAVVTNQLGILAKVDEIHRNRVRVMDVDRLLDGDIVARLQSYNLAEHLVKYFKSSGYKVKFEVLEATAFGVPQRRERVIFLGTREDELGGDDVQLPQALLGGENRFYTVEDAIADLAAVEPATSVDSQALLRDRTANVPPLAQYLRGRTQRVHNHVRTNTTELAQSRYEALKPGQNFHDLPTELVESYADPSRTQRNIYRRLEYDAPSPTVTNVRKAMWIHPRIDRAITIREAARLQSFPDRYQFCGVKDAQYQQVGNAVPPLLAQAVGEAVAKMLGCTPTCTLYDLLSTHPPLPRAEPPAAAGSAVTTGTGDN